MTAWVLLGVLVGAAAILVVWRVLAGRKSAAQARAVVHGEDAVERANRAIAEVDTELAELAGEVAEQPAADVETDQATADRARAAAGEAAGGVLPGGDFDDELGLS